MELTAAVVDELLVGVVSAWFKVVVVVEVVSVGVVSTQDVEGTQMSVGLGMTG